MTTAITAVRTVQEQVVDNLRRLILEGDFAPGDKLQQEELAALLGVSAMPVREGLRRLQAEGLVEFIPRRGAFVATLSADEFDELYHIREELEALGFRWAMERIGPEEVERLAVAAAQSHRLHCAAVKIIIGRDGDCFVEDTLFPFYFYRDEHVTGINVTEQMLDFLLARCAEKQGF